MNPYYDHGGIVIYHGDQREILPSLPRDSAEVTITDPPYSPAFHEGARTGDQDTRLVDFEHIEMPALRTALAEMGRVGRTWIVSFMDWRHATDLEKDPPAGLRFVRLGVWVKTDGAPQFSGDRPAPGWEGIAFLHRKGGRMEWNGGGHSCVFSSPIARGGEHPTEKPLGLIRRLVSLFSTPGGVVLDPFMGSGTTLRAAKDEGRKAIGIEREERYCELAARKLAQEVLF